MKGRDPLALAALGALTLASLVMIPFEWWFTRLIGVLLLFAFVILGVFAIASPALLVGDEPEDDAP